MAAAAQGLGLFRKYCQPNEVPLWEHLSTCYDRMQNDLKPILSATV